MNHPNFVRKLALLSPHQVQCDWTAVEVNFFFFFFANFRVHDFKMQEHSDN